MAELSKERSAKRTDISCEAMLAGSASTTVEETPDLEAESASSSGTESEGGSEDGGRQHRRIAGYLIGISILCTGLAVYALGSATGQQTLAREEGFFRFRQMSIARPTPPAGAVPDDEFADLDDRMREDFRRPQHPMWRQPTTNKTAVGDCEDNEEKFFHLCYRKCSLLTNGVFPVRSAPNACRKEEPSNEVSIKLGFFCSGYWVGGDGHCPHTPDTCDANEERHLGLCYMKCDLLTGGEYPIRAAPNTCCRQKPCWNFFHVKTRGIGCMGFGVGGGLHGHRCGHRPSRKIPQVNEVA